MHNVYIKTKKAKEIVDITDLMDESLKKYYASEKEGLFHLFLIHTTAALTTADLDPGTDLDMLDAFDAMIPKLNFRHPHHPAHVPNHIMSSIIGTSLLFPVKDGKLVLGAWQRVVLVELDGPREREVMMNFVPAA